jgi:hypothetical protein
MGVFQQAPKDKSGEGYKKYIEALRRMTPERRLLRAFEFLDFTRQLLKWD